MVTFIKIVVMNFLCIHACTYMAENSTLSNFGCMHYSLILIYIMCVALKYSIHDFFKSLACALVYIQFNHNESIVSWGCLCYIYRRACNGHNHVHVYIA